MFPPRFLLTKKEVLPCFSAVPSVSLVCFCCLARNLRSTAESPWLLNPYLQHTANRGGARLEGNTLEKVLWSVPPHTYDFKNQKSKTNQISS
jgi:hypothetical protein